MKTISLKILLCSFFVSLLISNSIKAQYIVKGHEVDTTFSSNMNHIFGTLNSAKIPFGLLRDYGMEFTNLENFNGFGSNTGPADNGIFMQIYTTLATMRINSSAFASLHSPGIVDSLWSVARKPGQVTLSGLFYQYSWLASNADSTGKITVTNGQLFDKYVNGVWQNPYLQGSVVGFAPAAGTFLGQNFVVNLPANLWLTNSSTLVGSIQIDAGDGLGYRTITPGTNLPVSYADTGIKVLNFKINLTNSTMLQTKSQLHILQDPIALYGGAPYEGEPITNHGVTTTQYSNVYNVTSTATYNGYAGQAVIT